MYTFDEEMLSSFSSFSAIHADCVVRHQAILYSTHITCISPQVHQEQFIYELLLVPQQILQMVWYVHTSMHTARTRVCTWAHPIILIHHHVLPRRR